MTIHMKPNKGNKKAQIIGLAIVLIAIGILSGAALYMTNTSGNQMSGMGTYSGGCNGAINSPGYYTLDGPVSCTTTSASSSGILINTSDVVLDCGGLTISTSEDLSDPSIGIMIANKSGVINTQVNNVTVVDCNIVGFRTAVNIGYFDSLPSNTYSGYYIYIANNTISDTRTGIFSDHGYYHNILGNVISDCVYGWYTDGSAYWMNVTRNTFECSSADTFVNVFPTSIHGNFWLNNYKGAGVAGADLAADFCLPEEGESFNNTFGNYYEGNANYDTRGCDGVDFNISELDDPWVLPLGCGATVFKDILLDEDFIPSGCSFSALQIADDLTLSCSGHSILGSGNTGTYGINITGRTEVNITDCIISGFDEGIHIEDSTGVNISNNFVYNNTKGITSDATSNSNNFHNNIFKEP